MKKTKSVIILSVALASLMLFFAGCKAEKKNRQPLEEKLAITVTVVHKDKSEKEFEIETSCSNLGEALFEEGIVNEEEYKSGFYTVIDGERADYNKDNAYWWIKENGSDATTGANDIELEDGDKFEFIYTEN